ncbi:MAG: hypothetical protein KDN22_03370 [Verrucomicrobiae bacterium]|nr:hypothetical protein [Verrucomicrobiae bacterium]
MSLSIFSAHADTPSPGSAERQARKAAAPFEKSGMRLRQDFWSGSLSGAKGKAIRLQFFKGHTYRLFLAGDQSTAPGTRYHVMVVDKYGNVLGESTVKGPVTTVEVKPRKTGAYLVLMRAETPKGAKATTIPAVLFYGYQ